MQIYKKNIHVLFVLFLFAFLSCGAQAKKTGNNNSSGEPEWINNPHKFYPQNMYIVGVGTGDTREAAENNAAGSIAKVFQSKIKVDQTVIENYLEQEKDGTINTSGTSQLLRKSTVGSNQELKNIKIDKSYFSANEGLYYALAHLDRKETARIYRKEISDNDLKIDEYHQLYEETDKKLTKYAYLLKAKTVSDVNEILNGQYGIIRGDGSKVPTLITQTQLNNELRTLTEKITVKLNAEEETPDAVTDYVKEAVAKFGFKIVQNTGDFSFNYSLDMKETDIGRANTVGYNWKLTLTVVDNINNHTLDTFNMKNRTIAISEDEAKAKIMHKVKNGLTTKFYKKFLDYINKY